MRSNRYFSIAVCCLIILVNSLSAQETKSQLEAKRKMLEKEIEYTSKLCTKKPMPSGKWKRKKRMS